MRWKRPRRGLRHPGPTSAALEALAGPDPLLAIDGLVAGYGAMEILHGVDLRLGAGQSLCLIGPNGAGKSTVLHSIYGFTTITAGRIAMGGRDVTQAQAQRAAAAMPASPMCCRTIPSFPR